MPTIISIHITFSNLVKKVWQIWRIYEQFYAQVWQDDTQSKISNIVGLYLFFTVEEKIYPLMLSHTIQLNKNVYEVFER